MMDTVLIIIGSLLAIGGILGSILPVLPGPILGYGALILLQLTSKHPFSLMFFVVWAVIIAILTFLDYVIPLRWTKRYGGSKRGIRGSTIWLVLSVLVLPILGISIWPFGLFGLIWWPLIWAYIGEKLSGKSHRHALRSARWARIGFVTGSLLKLIVSVIMAGYFFINL